MFFFSYTHDENLYKKKKTALHIEDDKLVISQMCSSKLELQHCNICGVCNFVLNSVYLISLITEYHLMILLHLLRCLIRLMIEMVSISIDLWMERYQDIYHMHLYLNRQIKRTFYHNECILLVVHLRNNQEKKIEKKI